MKADMKKMSTVEKCRYLANELRQIPLASAVDEAQILEDAADEIEDLRDSYVALVKSISKGDQ